MGYINKRNSAAVGAVAAIIGLAYFFSFVSIGQALVIAISDTQLVLDAAEMKAEHVNQFKLQSLK